MSITLIKLTVSGPGKPDALIDFRSPAMLVRGPSDTGKSYIRDCLWYLLDGDKIPKQVPEAAGYDRATLILEGAGEYYEVYRGLAGGSSNVYMLRETAAGLVRELLKVELSELLVKLSGAEGKQLLRSKSKRGGVTGGDLRHWFLISQPNMISEEATHGVGTGAPQRIAAFHLFITGSDDSAIELAKTNEELERLAGQILGAEINLKRVRADLPDDQTRKDVADALGRVDHALNAMTEHYEARASILKEVRGEILENSIQLQRTQREYELSIAMVERFELLEKKYISDSERLGATWEGMAMFQVLEKVPCPLCHTPIDDQPDPNGLGTHTQTSYSRALRAELEKIVILRQGLRGALIREYERVSVLSNSVKTLQAELNSLEEVEQSQLRNARHEFSGDPKTLALRRSELSDLLNRYDDEFRLLAEIETLTGAKKKKYIPLNRNTGNSGYEVARLAKSCLHEWGFVSIESVLLDTNACDLIIDGRRRLDFGAGKRALFLAAMAVAVMDYALREGHPHLGFVVVDSPLKSYSDPKSSENKDVSADTVTNRFYEWLSNRSGLGQIIILENEEIMEPAKSRLKPLEFIGEGVGEGRKGFYPLSDS